MWLSVTGTPLLSIGGWNTPADTGLEQRPKKKERRSAPKTPPVREAKDISGLSNRCCLFQGARDVPEGRVQVRSYAENDSNNRNRNTGRDEPIFDRCRAAVVAAKTLDPLTHLTAPKLAGWTKSPARAR